MKKYTVMPVKITKLLNSSDTYRYVALSFSPLKEGYTDSTFKQIAQYINPINPELESESTIKSFVKRLKESNLIKVETLRVEDKTRNRYYLLETEKDFRMIKNEFLYLDLPVEIKGFFLQLYSICINNTLKMNLSISKACTLIKVSKPSALKYLKVLIDNQLVIKTEDGYLLSDKYFYGLKSKSEQILVIQEFVKDLPIGDYYRLVVDNTNWDCIDYPEEFWNSVIGGYRGKQHLSVKEQIDDIIL